MMTAERTILASKQASKQGITAPFFLSGAKPYIFSRRILSVSYGWGTPFCIYICNTARNFQKV